MQYWEGRNVTVVSFRSQSFLEDMVARPVLCCVCIHTYNAKAPTVMNSWTRLTHEELRRKDGQSRHNERQARSL